MSAVGIDRAENHVVIEDDGPVQLADVEIERVAGFGDAQQTGDPGWRNVAEDRTDDRRRPRTLHQDIGAKLLNAGNSASVKGAIKLADQCGFDAGFPAIEDMDFEAALRP